MAKEGWLFRPGYPIGQCTEHEPEVADPEPVLLKTRGLAAGEKLAHALTVLIPEITAAQLAALPYYQNCVIVSPETEYQIRNVFVPRGNSAAEEDFYDHEHFNQEKFYGPRYPGADRV